MNEKLLYLILFIALTVMLMLPAFAGFTEAALPVPKPESERKTQEAPPPESSDSVARTLPQDSVTAPVSDAPGTTVSPTNDGEITVSVYFPSGDGGEARNMPLEEYVRGAVMAEMPASFHPEALKAQAVAARTYCMYHLANGMTHGDTGACICTDYSHCMAYLSDEDARLRWGDETAAPIIKAAADAAEATRGKIMTYEGKPIAAVFHASSGGYTESAENVWGNPVPYLLSVSSPEKAEVTEVEVPLDKWRKTFSDFGTDDYTGMLFQPTDSVTVTAETDSAGRVKALVSCGKRISGTDLRSALKLRSTLLTVTVTAENVVLTVTGNGHGVGMSQYGADAMGDAGADYTAILAHYYTGVFLENAAP